MAIVINGSGTVTGLAVGGLPDGTVDAGTLATNSVDSAELIDGAVDNSHMAAMAASKLTGALPIISGASLTGVSGRRNLVKNGGFDVWQRGTSFTNVSGKNYIADRWWCTPNSGAHTQTRQASGLNGFDYCLRMQRNAGQTAGGVVYLLNEFESIDSSRHRGKKLTFSFYARKGANFSHSSSYLTSNLTSGTGTDQSLSAGLTGGAGLISVNNTLTTDWQKFTHTTSSVLASNVNQICIQFTTVHAGTAGTNDYYELAGVQLEVGTEATDFENRSFGEELALCQRYHCKGSISTTGNGSTVYISASSMFPQQMRATPTIVLTDDEGNVGKCSNDALDNVAASVARVTNIYVHTSVHNVAVGQNVYYNQQFAATAEI